LPNPADPFGVAAGTFERVNGTVNAERPLIESGHGDARCCQALEGGDKLGTGAYRADKNDQLCSSIDWLLREGEAAGSVSHASKSIASFHLGEEALARLEIGLRAQQFGADECSLQGPHAVQPPPMIALPPVDEQIGGKKQLASTMANVRRPSESNGIPTPPMMGARGNIQVAAIIFLVVSAIAAPLAYYFAVRPPNPRMDFSSASKLASMDLEPVEVPPVPLPRNDSLLITVQGSVLRSGSMNTIKPAPSTENGIETTLPQTLSATEYRATAGERHAMPGSSSVQQASPKSGADAALGGQDIKPLIERESLVSPASVQVSTCFPSASAVRQEHPEAWPSWTLRGPGHEGTKCWYPATRANGPRSSR
jgi:hypothetical protein